MVCTRAGYAPQPVKRKAPEYAALSLEEIYKWIAITPSPKDKVLLANLLRIDAGVRENRELKR